MTGTISTVKVDKGFGFIATPGEDDTFFHCSALQELEFNEQLTGQRVEFDIERDQRSGKLRASFVAPAKD